MDTALSITEGISKLKAQAEEVFNLLDVSPETRTDYKYRIGLFIDRVSTGGFTYNSFLEYKRYLAERPDISISTKNKYFATNKAAIKRRI